MAGKIITAVVMYSLSKTSKKHYDTLDPRWQLIIDEVLKVYDVSIIQGHRNKIGQDTAYANGFSKLKWPLSKHNTLPSKAVDIAPWNNGIDWDDVNEFYFLAGIVMAIAERHFIKIRWGGRWVLLKDYVHFEIVE